MEIDHIAIQVEDPEGAAAWYVSNFGAELIYADSSWAFVQFENVKLAFVVKEQHPPHFAFKVEKFNQNDRVKSHRDGSMSAYKKDPWGNIYELICYEEQHNDQQKEIT